MTGVYVEREILRPDTRKGDEPMKIEVKILQMEL